MRPWALPLAIAIALPAAAAHHSISSVYDTSRETTLEGIVTEFRFVNPHPFLIVEVQDESGTRQLWRLEMDNRVELTAIGFTSETLEPGDLVMISGNPARRQTHSLYIRRLDRPSDGFSYEQVGGTPRIRNAPPILN